MQELDVYHGEIIHLFTAHEDAAHPMSRDAEALSAALGGVDIDMSRVEVVDRTSLAGLWISPYLIEGQGADADAVSADAERLDAIREPVILLLPGAVRGPFEARSPLLHLGSYPLERATPAGPPVRSTSARGETAGTATADPEKANRRASGYVALVAVLVALLIALVVWAVSV